MRISYWSSDVCSSDLLAMTEIGDQSRKALRLFNRVEIGALDVFNQRKLEARGIVKFADDRRNLVKSRRLRRPPAPLAGNDFISLSLVDRPHQDRLDTTLRADRLAQLLELYLIDFSAGMPLLANSVRMSVVQGTCVYVREDPGC